MKIGLDILLIEDDENDVLRIGHELNSAGVIFCVKRVETEKDFVEALRREPPDVILSDHGLPSFDGFAALQIAQQERPDIPFIFVSGTFNLPSVVEMIENGAAGYVYKNRISELVPAIEEALESAADRRREPGATPPARAEIAATRLPPPQTSSKAAKANKPAKTTVAVCSKCKRVRTAQGGWEPLDSYLRRCGEATITLALCPDCSTTSSRWNF